MKNPDNRKTKFISAIFMAGASIVFAAPAMAKDKDDDNTPPPIFQAVIDCKTVTDPEERLSCYDEKVAALEAAQESKQVVIADREQIKEARRGLFGFSLPKIKLFSGGDDDEEEEEIKELNTTVKSARRTGRGLWVITVEDGAVWEQTERSGRYTPVESGDEIRIKRATLGSYKANINGGLAIRVRRIR